jgi:S1-C subfamily serine protease
MVTRCALLIAMLFCGLSSIALAQEQISSDDLRVPNRGSPEASKSPAPTPGSPLLEGISPKNALSAVEKLRPERRQTRGAHDSAIFRDAAPAVVLIVTDEALGSGTLLKSGNILTNAHVVGAAKQVGVVFKPAEMRAPNTSDIIRGDVLRIDQVKDLALVHPASVPANRKPLDIDATDAFEVGADVHAIGHPTGEFWSYTKGIISQIRPDYVWRTEERGIEHKATVIQTQTPINPGNSGGPLISDDEKLIGVNSFKAQGEGLNYAVAAKSVREFLAETPPGSESVAQGQQGGSQAACEPKLLFQGRSADGTAFMRQFSLRCDDTVDLTIVEPDNKKEPFFALLDSERRGKIDAIVLDPRRKHYWEKSFWDVYFDDTFSVVGLHRNGEFQPYRFEMRCPGKPLKEFKCA